jgi:hypothetical protein
MALAYIFIIAIIQLFVFISRPILKARNKCNGEKNISDFQKIAFANQLINRLIFLPRPNSKIRYKVES